MQCIVFLFSVFSACCCHTFLLGAVLPQVNCPMPATGSAELKRVQVQVPDLLWRQELEDSKSGPMVTLPDPSEVKPHSDSEQEDLTKDLTLPQLQQEDSQEDRIGQNSLEKETIPGTSLKSDRSTLGNLIVLLAVSLMAHALIRSFCRQPPASHSEK